VRAKSIAVGLAVAAIMVLCLPMGALARTRLVQVAGGTSKEPSRRGSGKKHTSVTQKLSLRGSNGYTIEVKLSDRRMLEVDATAVNLKSATIASVAYELKIPRQPGTSDISARMGSLGRIDFHFVPEKTEREKAACEGALLTTETGHYVGSFTFHGDGGFTNARAHRVPGTVEREIVKSCHLPKTVEKDPKTEREEAETADKVEKEQGAATGDNELQLTALLDGGKVAFAATRLDSKSKVEPITTSFIVLAKRRHGRISEGAFLAKLKEKAATFQAPDPTNPAAETIVTPASLPFRGSATFRREAAKGSRWAGDLRVYIPGFGTVPLTAPGAKTTLCVSGCPASSFSLAAGSSAPG
jgi:hypothetical protein